MKDNCIHGAQGRWREMSSGSDGGVGAGCGTTRSPTMQGVLRRWAWPLSNDAQLRVLASNCEAAKKAKVRELVCACVCVLRGR